MADFGATFRKPLSVMALSACATAMLSSGALQAKPRQSTFEIPIEITPKRNLKVECSQLVAAQTDLDQALEVCNEAIAEAPDDGDRYYFRSYAHFYRDEIELAKADATRAIELNCSQLAKAYYLRGTIKEHQRELREAAADFEKALDLSPDWSAARRKVDSYAWAYEAE